ncbi:hypothetical protein ASPWEDRAFT_59592 [Aspergillus wentii DTO 134E9]|uniref:Cytochrome P450 n=1 Tax=Aspergillus wentii DTO 134E9 TaxID=1073089 RepID=A0A1L9RJQ1_ASPWE|nr:uncharacterized protein ASPWEDRAFT_59592 [Aspergillus wentii DTO 134E9]KAI9923846.1 hypothetical protein MW887_008328 [Aspergillus wentii]OJJ35169.1 hypothetical protein ASPWEDRAFT_59592 [Aspergillus wentii DTO 134E9]
MVTVFTIVLQCALAALVARVVYLCYFHPLARYPGPWLARFTDIWRLLSFLNGNHHLTEQRLHERYGRVVRIAPNWLSFSSLEDFETIYGFHKSIEKGDFYTFGRGRGGGSGSIFSTKDEATHRIKKRKILGPALSSTKVAGYEAIVSRHIDVLVSRAEQGLDDRGKVNMAPLVHRFTLDTMLEVIFGPSLSAQKPYTDTPAGEGLTSVLRVLTKRAWSFSLWPVFGWLMNTRLANAILRRPTHNKQGTPTGMSALFPAIQSLIFARNKETAESPQPGIVKNWLQVPSDDTHRMELREIFSEAANLVIAGPGSTAAAVTAILFHLGAREGQIWQDKLRKEANAAPSSSTTLPPHLNAVIKETLRLRAAFPTAFPRVIRPGAETALSSTLSAPLPVGTTISANTYVLGRSREIWGDDADDWVPQRWVGAISESQYREMETRLVAFSKGSRGCVGRDLALLVIGLAVMGIVKKWRFRSVGELSGKSFLEMQYDDCWIEYESIR